MTDIRVEKKRSKWPWLFMIFVILAILIFLYFYGNSESEEDEVLETTEMEEVTLVLQPEKLIKLQQEII